LIGIIKKPIQATKAMKKNITGYKGFDINFRCLDFQFEENKIFETDNAKICQSGFHFCENPFDVFCYYPPADSRYANIKSLADCKGEEGGSKKCTTKIKIGAEINLHSFIQAGVKFILDKVDWNNKKTNTGDQSAATNTGYRSAATNTGNQSAATNIGNQSAATNTGNQSAATNTGYQSAATNTGNQSAATNTGYQSAAIVNGKESIALACGYKSQAKGGLGCWIVIAEWLEKADGYHIVDVRCEKVDGKNIKADTFYRLENGKFVEI